jgi:uncharacterized protein YcbX
VPHLAHIRLHPIKALDGVPVSESRIGVRGGLEFDRVWALFADDGSVINGKRTADVQLVRARFDPDLTSVVLSAHRIDRSNQPPHEFAFPADHTGAGRWFSEFFNRPVTVRYDPGGFPDDPDRNGPLVMSTGTLQTVAGWFDGLDLDECRRRFRAPIEIGGVPPFWEDRLYVETEDAGVRFRIGDVAFEGVNPCPRCVVPTRSALTGVLTPGFQATLTARRRAELPAWARTPLRIGHFYHLGINTRVAATERGKPLRLGDSVAVADV